jgi:hypothetical protein
LVVITDFDLPGAAFQAGRSIGVSPMSACCADGSFPNAAEYRSHWRDADGMRDTDAFELMIARFPNKAVV